MAGSAVAGVATPAAVPGAPAVAPSGAAVAAASTGATTGGTLLTPTLAAEAAWVVTGNAVPDGGLAGDSTSTSTKAVPLRIMSSLEAAVYDRSMMRLATNGPLSLMRTTTLRPFERLVTRA